MSQIKENDFNAFLEKELKDCYFLCTICKEYVKGEHKHSAIDPNPFERKPKPPYCSGCGTVVPTFGTICQTCRMRTTALLGYATFSKDLYDACSDYTKRCAVEKIEKRVKRKLSEVDDDEEDENSSDEG